jgi:hypothetical protein
MFSATIFLKDSLVFNNVSLKEVRIATLLLPPKEALLNREKKRKGVWNARQ